MVTLEVLMRAAEGDGASVRSVADEVKRMGWHDWAREAIRARVDPLLAAAVLPVPARVEVARALVVFYSSWGGCFPREYRGVRREWRVLRDRWQSGGRARAYGELLAAVGAPAPALAGGETAAACARAASAFVTAAGEDRETGRRPPPASVEGSTAASADGNGAQATSAGAVAGGLGHDEPLPEDDTGRDADAEADADAAAGDTASRDETGEEGVGKTLGGGANSVLPDGAQVTAEIGPEALEAALWMERLREAAGRGGAAAVKRLREAWLDSDREAWFEEWLEPVLSRTRERAGR